MHLTQTNLLDTGHRRCLDDFAGAELRSADHLDVSRWGYMYH